MISDKVCPRHLKRKVISMCPSRPPTRSSVLQYAMRDRLTAPGWYKIEVIDDLGRSAAGGVQRASFEREVAKSPSARSA